jgi:solute carrier family 20 (sodium-dependent phosphate transporter)
MTELYLSEDIESYLWIVIVGGIIGFIAAMGIGSNDTANSFASSLGAESLTVKQAVIIALFCEAGGAIILGSHVTDTIRKGITDYECFVDNPVILMFGAMSVLLSVGIWLFIASYFEMPVSTTHTVVGGMIGMTMAIGGVDCVNWYEPSDSFPFVGGVAGIIVSWIISPVFSALFAMMFFAIIRSAVLRHPDSFERGIKSFPVFVGVTVVLNIFLIIYKGAKGIGLDDIELWVALVSAFGGGIGVALIMIPLLKFIKEGVLKSIIKQDEKKQKKAIEMVELGKIKNSEDNNNNMVYVDSIDNLSDKLCESKNTQNGDGEEDVEGVGNDGDVEGVGNKLENSTGSISTNDIISRDGLNKNQMCLNEKELCDCSKEACMRSKYCRALTKSLNYEVHTDLKKDAAVQAIHDNAEKFDKKAEEAFKSLQVFTAVFDSFSHGANDVANAIGPFAAIYVIYKNRGVLTEDSELGSDAYWILALGGAGIIVGLVLYGYKIMRAIGVKMCAITPTRGVSIELASATVVIIGSRLGIPLSTTHCQVGATLGVAALEDLKTCKGINCALVGKTILGWILTLLVAGCTSALLVSYSVYAPCIRTVYQNATLNGTDY